MDKDDRVENILPLDVFSDEGITWPFTVGYKETLDKLVDFINEIYFYVAIGAKGCIGYKDYDSGFKRITVQYISPATFHELFRSKLVQLEITREQRKHPQFIPLSKFWMEHPKRATYKAVVFSPDQPVPKDKFNLWRDFRKDACVGDCQPFLDFVFGVICDRNAGHYEYVLAWLADAVQNLTAYQKPGVALVLRGDRGVGKGFFATHFGALFGQHFLHVSNPHHVTGKFNRHQQDCLLLFADEMFGTKQDMGILQTLITEPRIMIEIKGMDAYQAPNYMRIIIASNREWVVPAGPNERRWVVLDVSNCHIQDTVYFSELDRFMKSGGREALLHYLLHFDYSKIDLRKIPRTSGLADQLISTMDSIESYWHSLLQKGSYPVPSMIDEIEVEWGSRMMVKNTIYNHYIKQANMQKQRPRTDTAFWARIRKLCPALRDVRDSTTDYQRGFEVPPLKEARDLFDKLFGYKFQWQEEGDED